MTTGLASSRDAEGSAPAEYLDLVVTHVQWEADDVVSLTFADPAGGDLPEWRPGAHLELVLPNGLVRQYSLCGSPGDRSEYRVAVLREANGRGGSRWLHDTGLAGKRMKVIGPRNRFELVPSPRYLFIAGGIGITPILAMVRSLGATASWSVHYGGRTRSSMAFTGELLRFGGDSVVLRPQDEDGPLDVDAIVNGADELTAIYCCGPAPLLEAVQEAWSRRARGALYTERFAAAPARTTATAATSGDNRAIEVELRSSGVTVDVGPERSVLDAIREAVPDAPYSCGEGYCGSCEVTVLEGIPDHRDDILTTAEREGGRTMFPCVSRARSERLVLDV